MEVLSILKHPNIIAYFDNFVEEKSLMIVMEYAPGGTLFEFIQDRNGVLMEEEVGVSHQLTLSHDPPPLSLVFPVFLMLVFQTFANCVTKKNR